jgi:hypothetical protein
VTAAWQEQTKLGVSQSLDVFVARLDGPGNRWWKWATLDAAQALSRLDDVVPEGNITIVTLPARGAPPTLLWERFRTACGIPAGSCDTANAFARASIGVVGARLLELSGAAFRDAVQADAHRVNAYEWIQRYVAHELLSEGSSEPIALRPTDAAAVAQRSASMAERLRDRGYRVVGDLNELLADPQSQPGRHPEDVSAEELLHRSISLNAALLGRAYRSSQDR